MAKDVPKNLFGKGMDEVAIDRLKAFEPSALRKNPKGYYVAYSGGKDSDVILDLVISGFALCIVELVDCRPMYVEDQNAARCEWYHGAWSWILSNIRPIQPFRVQGYLGIYEVEIED